MIRIVEQIAAIAKLLDTPLQQKLWEYAELLYVEQIVFESTDVSQWKVEGALATSLQPTQSDSSEITRPDVCRAR